LGSLFNDETVGLDHPVDSRGALENESLFDVDFPVNLTGNFSIGGDDFALDRSFLGDQRLTFYIKSTDDSPTGAHVTFGPDRSFEDGAVADEIDVILNSACLICHGG
jgi:hypothetical protein